MAAPTVVSRTTFQNSTAALTHAVTLPGGIAAGDLLITIASNPGAPWGALPSGWTQIPNVNLQATNGVSTIAAYRHADGSEGATATWSITAGGRKIAAVTYQIRGHEAGTAPEGNLPVSTSTSPMDVAALTASWGALDNLWLAVCVLQGALLPTGYPAGYGTTVSVNSTGGSGTSNTGVGATDRAATAATEDPGTFTKSGANTAHTTLIVVKPAAGGAPTNLVVQDATHGHTTDAVALTQVHALAVQDAVHAHSADVPSLAQVHALSVADASHVHAADAVLLDQAAVLVVADAFHTHRAGSAPGVPPGLNDFIQLEQQHALAVQDARSIHTATHLLPFFGVHNLIVAEAQHLHAADAVLLDQAAVLVVADGQSLHATDPIALTQAHTLAIADARSLHATDALALVQDHVLAVADTLHAHAADNAVLVLPGAVPNQGLILKRAGDVTVDGAIQGTAETSVFNGNVVGGTLQTNKLLIFRSLADVQNQTGASVQIMERLKYGTVTLHPFQTIALPSGVGTFADFWGAFISGENSTSQQRTMMEHRQGGPNSGDGGFQGGNDHGTSINSVSVDSTVDKALELTAQLPSASPNLKYRNRGVWVEYWTQTDPGGANGTRLLDRNVIEVIKSNEVGPVSIYSGIVPGGALDVGNLITLQLYADWLNQTGASQQVWLNASYGGQMLWDALVGVDRPSGAGRIAFPVEIWLAGNGATNLQVGGVIGHAIGGTTGSGDGVGVGGGQWNNCSNDLAVDSTVDQVFQITLEMSTASPNLSFRKSAVTMSRLAA